MPGTLIHHIEKYPNYGATLCTAAGTHAEILRKVGSKVIIKIQNRRPIDLALDENCYVTVGKVSNTNHYTVNLLCPQRLRWKSFKQASGLTKKKDGYCGRKNWAPKKLKVLDMRLEEIKTDTSLPIHILTDYQN